MVAVFSDTVARTKVSVWSPHLLANTVLLDAELTVGLPRAGTAATGMDAMIHAVESYTSRIATPATDLYAETAIRLISKNLRPAWARGDNLEARENMMTAAFYSGLALSNASTAGVHALSSPLGSEFHVPHGIANSIMLLPVVRRSLAGHLGRYAKIAAFMGEDVAGLTDREAADVCVAALDRLMDDLRVPRRMADYGVTKEDVPVLAKSVMQLTRLLSYNPYTITYDDAVAMYTDAL
jgi:alcohol dehydrogenase class IV